MPTEVKSIQAIETIEKVGTKTPTEEPDNNRIKESMDFADRHNTVLERVKYIMKFDKYARKDYLWLLLVYYAKCSMIKIITPLENFGKKNSPESINRCRRELYKRARGGDSNLKWLLTNQEFLEDMDKEKELYNRYYQNKKNEQTVREFK